MKIKNIKKKNYREVKTTKHVFFFFLGLLNFQKKNVNTNTHNLG